MGKEWYVVHTYSGFENKVKDALLQRAEAYGLKDAIDQVLVPTEDVVEVKGGKKVVSTKKLLTSYILVHMEMSDAAWHLVRDTPKVTGFVGAARRPTPVPQEEVDAVIRQVSSTAEKPKPRYTFDRGEHVRIVDGPFNNFSGVIEEVNNDRSTVKVMVTIFGRATPVELDFLQVEKI